MKRLQLLALCLLLPPLCWLGPALAQETPEHQSGEEDILEILDNEVAAAEAEGEELDLGSAEVLGQRSLLDVLSDTTALTILPAGTFEGAASVGEVLERVPGTDVRQSGGTGQLSTVQVRGARANQVLVLLDGVPVSPGVGADLSALPLRALERVEILRGPEAARFGPGALGGVVNLVTRRPRYREKKNEIAPDQPLNEQLGDLVRPGPPGEPEPAVTVELLAGSFSTAQAALTWDAPSALLGFEHNQARNDFTFQRNGTVEKRRNNDARRDTFWATWDAGGLAQSASLSHLERGVPGSAEFPTLSARYSRSSLSWQGTAEKWRAGFTLERSHFHDPAPYLHSGALDNTDTRARLEWAGGVFAGQRDGWGVKPSVDLISSSAFGDQARGGLDVTYAAGSGQGRSSLQAEAGVTSATDAGAAPLARLGWRYQLDRHSAAYAAAGYAVRFPSFDELYLTGLGSIEGNPDLDPERAINFEAGYTAATSAVSFTATGFYTRYYDSIIFAPVSAYLVRAINTGRARVAGIEALLDVPAGSRLVWRNAYTWLPVAEFDSGIPLAGRAEQHLNSRLEYADNGWRTALELDYTGRMPADLFGGLVIKPRSIATIEAEKRLRTGILNMKLSNLFDTSSRDAWSYPLPGRELFISWKVEL